MLRKLAFPALVLMIFFRPSFSQGVLAHRLPAYPDMPGLSFQKDPGRFANCGK